MTIPLYKGAIVDTANVPEEDLRSTLNGREGVLVESDPSGAVHYVYYGLGSGRSFWMRSEWLVAKAPTINAAPSITISVEQISEGVFEQHFEGLLYEFLCGVLRLNNHADAQDWMIAKIAAFRGVPEHEVQGVLELFFKNKNGLHEI